MNKMVIRLFVFPIIILSATLACRIGGLELRFDPETESWIEPVTGTDVTHLSYSPESAGLSPMSNINAIAEMGEICEVHAETPLCKAVLSGDVSAIESLSVELQISDIIYLSEALSESFAGLNAGATDQR